MIVTKCSRARSGGGGGLLAQSIVRRGMASRQVAPHSPPPTRAVLDTITSMARPAPHTSASLLFRSTTTTDAATAMMMMATTTNPSSFLLRATTTSAGASVATGEGVKNNKSSTAAVGAQPTTAPTITSGTPSYTTAAAGCGFPPTSGSLAESAASLDHHEGEASGARHTVAAAAAASSPPPSSSTPSSLWSQFLLTLRDGSSVPFHYLPVHRQTALLHAVQQDPSVAATWLALAQLLQTGETVNVHQRRYSGTQCCVQAVVLDPKSAEAWFALGLRLGDRKSISIPLLLPPHQGGGGNDVTTAAASPSQTAGTPTSTQQAPLLLVDRLYCYQQAVEQDPSNKTYWSHLAIHLKLDDTVVIHGRRMTEIECFVKSLEMDASPAVEWYTLSRLLAGNQKRKQQTQRRSNQPEKGNGEGDNNEDAEDPLHPSRVWIHQTLYSAKDCLVEVLRRDFSATMAWFDLAEALGEEEEENAAAMLLSPTGGIAGGGGPMTASVPPPAAEVEINGKQYNRLLCCVKAAERDPTLSLAWYHLGRCLKAAEQQQTSHQTSSPPPHSPSAATGGGVFVVVDDRRLNRQQCFAEAVKRDASHAAAWAELAETLATHHQRVTLGPRGTVTSTECLVEAVTLDPQNVGYWWRLAVVLRRKDEHEAQKKRSTMAKQTSTSERRQAPQGSSVRQRTATSAHSHTARTVEEEGEEETHRCRRLHSVEVRHIVYHEMECIEEVLSRDPAHAQALARQRELRGEEAHCPNHFSGIA